jgi:hypothetical protein
MTCTFVILPALSKLVFNRRIARPATKLSETA